MGTLRGLSATYQQSYFFSSLSAAFRAKDAMHAIPTKITPNTIYSIKPPLLFYFSYLFTFFVYCLVDKKCNDDTKTQEHQGTDGKPSLHFLVICNAPSSYGKECRYQDSKPKAQHCEPFLEFIYLYHSTIIA